MRPGELRQGADRGRLPAQGLGLVPVRLQALPAQAGGVSGDRGRGRLRGLSRRRHALSPAPILFKKYLFAGLLIWVPIAVTFWVIQMVVGMLDQTINFLPEHLRPVNTLGFHI